MWCRSSEREHVCATGKTPSGCEVCLVWMVNFMSPHSAALACPRQGSHSHVCVADLHMPGVGGLVVWGSSPVWHTGRRERPHTKRMKAERCSGENLVGGSVVGGKYQVAGGRVEVVSSIVSG